MCCFVAEPSAESSQRPGPQIVREVELAPSKLASQKVGRELRRCRTMEIRVREEDFESCGSDLQRLRRCSMRKHHSGRAAAGDMPAAGLAQRFPSKACSAGSPLTMRRHHTEPVAAGDTPVVAGLTRRVSTTARSESSNAVASRTLPLPRRSTAVPLRSPSDPALVSLTKGWAGSGQKIANRPVTGGQDRDEFKRPSTTACSENCDASSIRARVLPQRSMAAPPLRSPSTPVLLSLLKCWQPSGRKDSHDTGGKPTGPGQSQLSAQDRLPV